MDGNKNNENILKATSDIVASYVSNHEVARDNLPQLIEQVYETVSKLGDSKTASAAATATNNRPLGAAVSIEESITPDYIICLEDGKRLKMLKRYLKNNYDMTPEEYRKRWGLPANYPMVAPNYAKKRSQLAKKIGLGRHDNDSAPAKKRLNYRQLQGLGGLHGKLRIISSSPGIATNLV